jgi:hypothetical protein
MTEHPDDPIVRLLASLIEGNVEFIIVGGAAAVLAGVPVVTKDLDIVHRRTPENVERLLAVLAKLDAHFRPDFAQRKLRPRESDLTGHGHLYFNTTYGPLDVLCEVSGARGFDELLPHTALVSDFDLKLRVLDLPMLIKVKAEANRPKDRLALPILMATLEERQKPGGGE